MKIKRQYFPDADIKFERAGFELKITIYEHRGDWSTGTQHQIIAHVPVCNLKWIAAQFWKILRSYREELETAESAMRQGDA